MFNSFWSARTKDHKYFAYPICLTQRYFYPFPSKSMRPRMNFLQMATTVTGDALEREYLPQLAYITCYNRVRMVWASGGDNFPTENIPFLLFTQLYASLAMFSIH
jgi:hypothetical protein